MFEELLAALGARLTKAGVPYMVIGGQAVLLYGEPRATKDIDVTLAADVDRLPGVMAALAGLELETLVNDPASFVEKARVLPLRDASTSIRVDLIFSDSMYEREAIGRSKNVRLRGIEVSFAAVEDLVIHKLIAARPRDIEDVKGVLAKNPGADRAYIRRWLQAFEEALEQPLVERFEQLLKEI